MHQARATLQLPNGLQVHLICRPEATRAAALVQVGVGSHDEPDAWPGLAHLLEHLLFAGSDGFQGSDRLMAWIQAAGGRVNAMTLATATAFFFEAGAQQLEPGLARLVDMLASPLLTPEAQQQETAIIDAEYRLLRTHAETLRAAALMQTLDGPPGLHRFHVGSLASFSSDPDALQQALRDYHQRFYHAANMTLWLQGPGTLDELSQLAHHYGEQLPTADVPHFPVAQPVTLAARRNLAVNVRGVPHVRLAFLLPSTVPATALTLFRQWVTDEAGQGLLATLRARGLCDEVQVLIAYRSAEAWVISLAFSGGGLQLPMHTEIEALFHSWRQALVPLSDTHLHHYAQLARRQADQQTPLDHLRDQAFGFPPMGEIDAAFIRGWQQLLAHLTPAQMARVWAAPDVEGETVCVQGFPLVLTAFTPAAPPLFSAPVWRFHPAPYDDVPTPLPAASVPLPHLHPADSEGMLLLRPAAGSDLSGSWGHTVRCALQTLAGDMAHRSGELTFARYQGIWLLTCRGNAAALSFALHHLTHTLGHLPASVMAQGARAAREEREAQRTDIPVRALLSQLPYALSACPDEQGAFPTHWAASLYGGDPALHRRLSHLLAAFPGTLNAPSALAPPAKPPARREWTITSESQDHALLIFCPLSKVTATTLAAGQLLAMFYEPRFFQRLRVEMNIGYVVSCRFHHSADRPGILFALQSPHLTAAQLLRHTHDFLNSITAELAALPADALASHQDALLALQHPADDLTDRAWSAWKNLPLTETAIRRLEQTQLLNAHKTLISRHRDWVVLSH
ncbi:pyrroloquinoline quinone biosynthesis protein PqqF [Nissabacter archeti]|uniref:Coenzyme PQQ synthesis protein F n=1 Tax=Nissabacter archeti TaxID=1917880 RepID=A0ABS5JH12_9GAMM|nr:pyrroloquinoline quinone biosynthesis protein PqqF [Nissabacter archeti]MBS0969269.1 pyrroloquinoline quinone biosynthesis protein PqqF [Nissabacter archeti]